MGYFEPKRFETFRGKSIYSYLGVRFFKKYLLLTDLILFRWQNKKQVNIKEKGIVDELKRLAWQTRRDEIIHIIFMLLIAIFVVKNSATITPQGWMIIFLVNLYANVYPLFVQRHNRIRYVKLLAKFSNKTEKSASTTTV